MANIAILKIRSGNKKTAKKKEKSYSNNNSRPHSSYNFTPHSIKSPEKIFYLKRASTELPKDLRVNKLCTHLRDYFVEKSQKD